MCLGQVHQVETDLAALLGEVADAAVNGDAIDFDVVVDNIPEDLAGFVATYIATISEYDDIDEFITNTTDMLANMSPEELATFLNVPLQLAQTGDIEVIASYLALQRLQILNNLRVRYRSRDKSIMYASSDTDTAFNPFHHLKELLHRLLPLFNPELP